MENTSGRKSSNNWKGNRRVCTLCHFFLFYNQTEEDSIRIISQVTLDRDRVSAPVSLSLYVPHLFPSPSDLLAVYSLSSLNVCAGAMWCVHRPCDRKPSSRLVEPPFRGLRRGRRRYTLACESFDQVACRPATHQISDEKPERKRRLKNPGTRGGGGGGEGLQRISVKNFLISRRHFAMSRNWIQFKLLPARKKCYANEGRWETPSWMWLVSADVIAYGVVSPIVREWLEPPRLFVTHFASPHDRSNYVLSRRYGLQDPGSSTTPALAIETAWDNPRLDSHGHVSRSLGVFTAMGTLI